MAKRGFVDIQLNGLLGMDFSAPGLDIDIVRKVTLDLADRGTIAYCPTIVTGPYDMYRENLQVLAQAMDAPEIGGHLLGIHMEGPFISTMPGTYGAHQPEFIRPPSVEDFDRFQEWADGKIAIMTLAPETPGAEDLIRHITSQGVVVLLGHHYSDDESMKRAVEAGAKGCTHLGNGLPNDIHRHRNPLWWQLACDDLWATFITDGHHLPAALIKVALRAKTLDRFIVISDTSPLAAMPPGIYDAFGKMVEIEPSGRISCVGVGCLAGSHSTMLECMNYLASLKLLTEDELWMVGCSNPLRLLCRAEDSLDGLQRAPVAFDGEKFALSA